MKIVINEILISNITHTSSSYRKFRNQALKTMFTQRDLISRKSVSDPTAWCANKRRMRPTMCVIYVCVFVRILLWWTSEAFGLLFALSHLRTRYHDDQQSWWTHTDTIGQPLILTPSIERSSRDFCSELSTWENFATDMIGVYRVFHRDSHNAI